MHGNRVRDDRPGTGVGAGARRALMVAAARTIGRAGQRNLSVQAGYRVVMATSASAHSILLIHGAGGGGWEWRVWMQVLQARGFACVAPDWQAVDGDLESTSLFDYLAQMRNVLHALPEPRAVVGASLGGLLAAMLAAEEGDALDALLLVNALPPAPWHAALPVRDWPLRVEWGRNARLASTRRSMPDADEASCLFAFRQWRDESGYALAQAHAGVDVRRPVARVHSIIGQDDADIPAHAGIAWARHWQASLEVLAGAGHLSPLFGAQAVACASRAADWLGGR